MNWEIHTYGGGDFLRLIFTAMASIFNNGDYFMAMKIVALATFVGIMVKVAFNKDGAQNFRYILVLIFFIYVALLPKATVMITDSVNPANSAVVANVPLGVAAIAGTASAFGWWATEAMEVTFASPLAKPTETGFLFHSSIMDAVNKVNITDPRTATNYRSFFSSCVIVDGIGHNRFTWESMLNAPDIDQFYKANVVSGVAGFFYVDTSGARSFQYCKAGYGILSNDITGGIPQTIKQISIPWTAEYGSVANASAMLNGALAPTVNALTSSTGTKDSITRQYMLKNSLDASLAGMAAELNDENAEKYVISKANYERTLTFSAVGKVAADKMPLLRTVLEGVIYALAPLIILFAIISPWQVSVAYAKALVWVSLWAPMFAVLHFARSYFDVANLVQVGQFYGGLSPNAISAVNNYMSEAGNITGYLMGGLPVICWLIISNSGAMLASFAGRAGDGFEKSVTKEVGDVVAGQGSVGGKDWKQTQAAAEGMNGAMQSQSAGGLPAHGGASITSTMSNGTQVTETQSGYTTINQAQSSMIVSQQAATTSLSSIQSQTQEAKSYEEATAEKAATATQALLSTTQAAGHRAASDTTNSNSDRAAISKAVETSNTTVSQSLDKYAKENGYSEAATTNAKASLGLSAAGSGIGIGGGTQAARQEAEKLGNEFMRSESGQQSVRQAAQNVNEAVKSTNSSVGNDYSRSVSSALTQQTSAVEEHSVAAKEAFSASQTETMARQNQQSVTIKNDDQMMHYAQSHLGYTPEAYDKMLHQVRGDDGKEAQQSAQLEYTEIMKATYNGMSSKGDVKADYAQGAAAIDKLNDAKIDKAEEVNQAAVSGAHRQYDAKVQGAQQVDDGVVSNQSPSAVNPLPSIDQNFGNKHSSLQTEVDPAHRSVVEGTTDQTKQAAESGVKMVGERVIGNVVDAATVGVRAYNAVADLVKDDPMDGDLRKK